MAHEDQQQPDPRFPGGWLPPVPPGQAPPPFAAPWQHAPGGPWPATLYYSYREPGNDAAVAGFCLAVGAIAALLVSAGIFFVISLPMAIAGTFLARRGLRRVREGATRQHGGLARVGFWLGLAAIVASIGAGTGWILAIVNGHVLDKSSPEPNRQTPALVRPL